MSVIVQAVQPTRGLDVGAITYVRQRLMEQRDSGTAGGLGFLALAALIFGQWKPLGLLGATFFFGLASTVANVSRILPYLVGIPDIVLHLPLCRHSFGVSGVFAFVLGAKGAWRAL